MINISWFSCLLKLLYWPRALIVNPGCLKCISGKNLSPANKNLLSISLILYLGLTYLLLLRQKTLLLLLRGATKGILLKGVFISKLLNNLLVSCCLRNFDFLLLHTTQIDNSIIPPFFCLCVFWAFTLCIFSTLQTIIR